ncbi:MAG: hypothetical protein PVSMB11_01250 [Desulfuromonadaceae bacterium]
MKKKTIVGAVLSLAVITLFGCGGGGGDGTTPIPVAGSTTITGIAAKGPINGGVVKVYAIKDGKVDRTAEIGSGTTDASGAYTVSIVPDKKPAGAVLVEVTSGTFTDEATGLAGVNLKVPLSAAVSTVVDGAKIAVTPMTHLAVKQVEGLGAFTGQEIDDANKQIGRFFQVGDIIKSQPFDPTKDAPAGASDDEKKYAGALGVFSQLSDKRKGAGNKLEDALGGIFDDLGKELKNNGGFAAQTLIDFNDATDKFNLSGKNKTGSNITKFVFKGGVLQLTTTGNLPANTFIAGLTFTVKIPDNVTLKFDPSTGEVAAGVVAPVNSAATGSQVIAGFNTATRILTIGLINVQPGIVGVGEFAHLEFDLIAGTPFPDIGKFAVSVNSIAGGSTTDPKAALIDLKTFGITVGNKSVTGL